MQRLFTFLLAAFLLISLAACGSKYVVTTKSGHTYYADGPLDLNVDDNTYTVQDEEGRKVKLQQEEIDKVTETEE